jgi:SpoIID/LytB domain protein
MFWRTTPFRARVALVTAAAALVTLALGTIEVGEARAYPAANVAITGHGFGHGRGGSQYGALGYAIDHNQSYTQILDHYYGNTTMGSNGNVTMTVRIVRLDDKETIVKQEQGHGTVAGAGAYTAMRAALVAGGQIQVFTGPDCAGPWTPLGGPRASGVVFGTTGQTDSNSTMLQTCETVNGAKVIHWYRGEMLAVNDNGHSRSVNRLDMNSYLKGNVPRESPASWGDLGGGKGMQALKFQAVAARSYAAASGRYSYAKICDTTSCQVYDGRYYQDSSGARDLEDARTNAAIAQTDGQTRVNSAGAAVSTEYSSSTGGYTAGGAFPAVVDEGDDTASNPNHTWSTTVAVSAVESAYGIGTLQSISVTQRNGLGDMGGRVLQMVVKGSSGSKTVSGDDFGGKLGLKSNWFTITNSPSGGISGYWVGAADGGVFSFGAAQFYGSMGGKKLNSPIINLAATPSGRGYWLLAGDGGVFTFGDAEFHGSTGAMKLNKPVVAMAPTPSGHGYWLVASDGGIFTFGDARFWGSTGAMKLNQPVVGMAPTPSGAGYWLVASDGGIFSFGNANFYGSTGAMKLNQPVIGMASRPTGNGYWLLAGDGGLFSFGDAPFYGSLPGANVAGPARGMAVTTSGGGYLIVSDTGKVASFGDAPNFGDVTTAVPGYHGGTRGIAATR